MTAYAGNPHDSPVWEEIADERHRQDQKWGEQNHGGAVWATVLAEEVGEFAEAVLHQREAIAEYRFPAVATRDMRFEAVQVAAVAVAIIEWIDRGCPIDATDLDVAKQPEVEKP